MKLSDLLQFNQDKVLPDIKRVQKQMAKKRSAKLRIIALICSLCAVALIATGAVLMLKNATEPPAVVLSDAVNVIESIEPIRTGATGMQVGSDLKVTTSRNVPPAELKARIEITPEMEYTVKKTGTQTYELRFEKDFEPNTLYTVGAVYGGSTVYRWAFQTESVFSITNAMPKDQSGVSLDSAVEVTFSHADVKGFEEAFSITPQVEGSFEQYGRTWAFVPKMPFEEATLYTVTVDKSVAGPKGTSLEEDYSFSFTTAAVDSYAYLLYQQNECSDTCLVDEIPTAAIVYNNIEVSSALVQVYSLDDAEAYADAYATYARNGVVSAEIMALAGEPHQKFQTKPVLVENLNGIYDQAAFINYPESLPQGYYFAEISLGNRKLYQLLQSTAYAVYTITTNGDYTVWVHDAMKGEAAENLSVSLTGFKDRTTDKKGIASFSGCDTEAEYRLLTVGEEKPYVAFLNGANADAQILQQNNYFTYLSTDSRLYRNEDTVGIFGVILPRKEQVKLPKTVSLKWDFSDEIHTVEVEENGTFTVKLPLGNTALTGGTIQLLVEETVLCETYIQIADYELPKYYVNITTDRMIYEVGETVEYMAQVTYMDGTPAPNISLSFADGSIGLTDENGYYIGSTVAEGYVNNNLTDAFSPEYHTLYCEVKDGTDAFYSDDVAYLVLPAPYLLNGSYQEGMVSVEANEVSYAKADQLDPDDLYGAETLELLRGSGATMKMTGELHCVSYEKEPDGTTYDPINKKVQYSWRYTEVDEIVRTFDLSIEGGIGMMTLPEEPDENKNYYIVLRSEEFPDAAIQIYLSDRIYSNGGDNRYNLSADRTMLKSGETAELAVRDGRDNEMINNGSVLYTVVCGEIADTFHSEVPRLSLSFKKEYIPDIYVYGAYFDGKYVYSLGFEYLYYDRSEVQLQIEMEKDKLQYRPGDDAELTFTVIDQEGKPVKAALNISVMDRALYLIGGGDLEAVQDGLFRGRSFSTAVYTTVSHREFALPEVGVGEGGGEGEPSRSDFEDTPYFETVETDKNGKVTVKVSLPDSLTQWKIMVRGVNKNLQSLNEVFDLVSTQGYFASVSMAESIKAEDDVTIGVKGDGIKADADAECSFTVGITDRDGNEVKSLTATAPKSQYAYLNFGALEEGLYTAYIQSVCGELTDSVIRTFEVVKAQSSVWIHHQQAVENGASFALDAQSGKVTLTVVDEQKAFWQSALARLSAGGERVDQVLGRYLAERYYEDGIWMNPETVDYAVIRSYMNYDGVKLLPSSAEGNLALSAKLAAIAPNFCDKELLKQAFEQYLNNRYAARVDVLTAYFGLAALREPVLYDLQALSTSVTDFTAEEYAYLALGLAYCGDYDTANYLYETHLKSLLTEADGLIFAEDETLTGCCALLANRLNLSSSEGLMNYIAQTDTEITLLNLELIAYLNDHAVETVGENTVMVSYGDGSNQSYSYSKNSALVLFLDEKQAQNVRVTNSVGNSYVSYAYYGTPEALADLGGGTALDEPDIPASLGVGQTAIISLYAAIPADFNGATLNCVLPAGLRLVKGTVLCGAAEYELYAPYNSKEIRSVLPSGACTVLLEVQGVLPGNYVLEPIVITNGADHRHFATSETLVSVVS